MANLIVHVETDFRDSDVKVGMGQVELDSGVHASRSVELHGEKKREVLEFKENF